MAVLDARRTRGFAAPARQTTIEMQLSRALCRSSLEHLFDLIDAPARSIELISQYLIGGAGGETEATVHTLAQDFIRGRSGRCVADPVGEPRFHPFQSRYQAAGIE